jgi:hypothetical protein
MVKSKEKYVQVCPKCKSPDIRQDKSTLQQIGALPTMYICNKCKYSSYVFPEVKLSELNGFEKEVDKLRDVKKDKSDLIDTAYGKFEVRFVWKIVAPIAVILGLIFVGKKPFFGMTLLALGFFMFYITYFKKIKLKS